MKQVNIHRPWTKVNIAIWEVKLPWVISEVSIKEKWKTAYNVSYYDNWLKTWWCDECEMEIGKWNKQSIWFKTQ